DAPLPQGDAPLILDARQGDDARAILPRVVAAVRANRPVTVLTCGALAGEGTRPIAAGIWGMVRSLRSERPELGLVLVDVDQDWNGAGLPQLIACGEPELAVRREEVLVPRLVAAGKGAGSPGLPIDPSGTVLVTGATGAIGR